MSAVVESRWRWRVWAWLIRLPGICNAKAHTLVVYGDRVDPRPDSICLTDAERNGSCWCGRIQTTNHRRATP